MATNNPLFPQPANKDDKESSGYVLPPNTKRLEPTQTREEKNTAADVIRAKVEAAYAEEPSVKKELAEIEHAGRPLSKHQQYLADLHSHSASAADIQLKWHEYYTNLPPNEKYEVWQEFYVEQSKNSRYAQFTAPKPGQPHEHGKPIVSTHQHIATPSASQKRLRDMRTTHDIKQGLQDKLMLNSQASSAKQGVHSLFFGLSVGAATLLIMLFGLFNETIIAPFVQPSRNVSATPIILNSDGVAADGTTKVIIPKINVEIPTDYSLTSMEEDVIQKGLETGVVHYPSTSRPGEKGNAAFFGHSSNNIFNPGKYKFAFVMLNNLQPGDMFYLTYGNKVYAYRIYEKKVVNPDEVWILNPVAGKTATAALVTCDPPGTTLKRLVVWGEQISPDPAGNSAAPLTNVQNTNAATELPGPPESLWSRLIGSVF